MTQNEIIEGFKRLPFKTYEKFGTVEFTVSTHEQEVITEIEGKVETKNIAEKGDFVLKGVNDECWVNTPEKFYKNYEIISPEVEGKLGKAEVKPQPRFAVQWNLDDQLTFDAPWGEKMVCNNGDYLVAPQDISEVYRVEKKIFLKTYKEC